MLGSPHRVRLLATCGIAVALTLVVTLLDVKIRINLVKVASPAVCACLSRSHDDGAVALRIAATKALLGASGREPSVPAFPASFWFVKNVKVG